MGRPRLTAANIEAGAHSSPQLGGWEYPHPWPGWKCCNPYVQGWNLGGNNGIRRGIVTW